MTADFTVVGLPVGIRLVGTYREDFSLLQFARMFEQATTVEPGKKPEEDMFFRYSERGRARGCKMAVMESDHTPQFSHVTEIVQLLSQHAS